MKFVPAALTHGLAVLVLLLTFVRPAGAGEVHMLKTIELSGSYHEIGKAWGSSMASELAGVIDAEIGGIEQFYKISGKDLLALSAAYLPAAKQYDPDFIAVLEGMAEGAGISFESLFGLRTELELLFYAGKIPAMCTAFAISGKATRDNITLMGQNIDWHPGTPLALLKITWPNGVKQICLTLGGIWEYPLSSHESSVPFGVASTLTVSMSADQEINRPPISMVMNKAARQKRLEQALAVLINSRKNLLSFLLADADGDMVSVELAGNEYEVRYPENDILVHANHLLTDRFKKMDFFGPIVPDSYLRYHRIKQLIDRHYGKITPSVMMKIMADHNSFPKALCSHVDPESPYGPSQTVASVIMVPSEKVIYIAPGQPCRTDYITYSLDF